MSLIWLTDAGEFMREQVAVIKTADAQQLDLYSIFKHGNS